MLGILQFQLDFDGRRGAKKSAVKRARMKCVEHSGISICKMLIFGLLTKALKIFAIETESQQKRDRRIDEKSVSMRSEYCFCQPKIFAYSVKCVRVYVYLTSFSPSVT